MTKVAKEAGLTRASLYKSFAPGAHPKHETIAKVLKSLGVQFKVTAA
jgi:probable addiction module antidote protein